MKNKRTLIIGMLSLLISLVCIASVFAHPGRTDSNGGHWDRKNGTYHFHTGEYAGRSSSGSSSNSKYVPFEPPYEPPTDNPYRKDNSKDKSISVFEVFLNIVGCAVALLFGVVTITSLCGVIYEIFLSNHMPKYKIGCLVEKITEYQNRQQEIINICVELLFLESEINIPDSYEIGTDDLPKEKNSVSKWGSSFTLYKTNKGKKLHRKYNCCFATKPVHIYWYQNRCDFSDSLCRKCASTYTIPDLSWYKEYLNCQKLKQRQSIEENHCRELREKIEILHKRCNSTTTKILIAFSKKNRNALNEANALYTKMQSGF